jgi:dihydrofolate reductase
MRRVALELYITLDGFNEFPIYPGSDEPRHPEQPDLVATEMWIKHWDSFDTLLFDAGTYRQWAEFWPGKLRKPEEHPWFHEMSRFADRVQKVVLSDGPVASDWSPTRTVPADPTAAIELLRKEPGKDMALVGGTRLAREFMRSGLIDDYYFAVFPVILGHGDRLFEELPKQVTLSLVEVRRFPYGEVFLHYTAVR